MELKNKVALVTGSAKRVGKAIALELANRGTHIMVHYNNSSVEAQKTVAEISKFGVKVFSVRGDLRSIKDIKRIVNETHKKFGRIDILVNSASVYEKVDFSDINEKDWDSALNTNLKAPFFLSQECGRIMQKQKCGKIVNIIDSDIDRPYKGFLPYIVSKFGLSGLTRVLAKELSPHIQVNGIAPGPVMLKKNINPRLVRNLIEHTPLKRIGTPEEVARAVLFCIESDYMTGAVIPVDGGRHLN